MIAGLFLAVFASLLGWKGAMYAFQRIEDRYTVIEPKHAAWVGVGLILWIGAIAFVCHLISGR